MFKFILLIISYLFILTQQQSKFNPQPKQDILTQSTFNPNYFEDQHGLIIVNNENYDKFIQDFNASLLFSFKSPCKLCIQIYPELEKTIQPLRKLSSPVVVAKLNTTESHKLAKRLKLEGLIGLKYIQDGMPMEYYGGRTGEEIVSWVRAKFDPIVGEIKHVDEIEQLRKFTEIVMIFFGDNEEKYSNFFEAAKGKDHIIFAKCALSDCLSRYSVENGDIMVFKKMEEAKKSSILRSSEYDRDSLNKKIEDLARPKVMKFNSKTATYIFSEENPAVFLYRTKSDSSLYDHLMLEVFDEAFKSDLKLVVTDIVDNYEAKLAKILDFEGTDMPRIVIHDTKHPSSVRSYVMDKSTPITKESIELLIREFKAGKLSPYLKSKPVPTEQLENAFTLVGKTLEEYSKAEDKDVLVMFYAPWCKNSKVLYPIYEELAGELKNLPDFSIAKFDAFSNDAGIIEIEFYPTIAIWPAHNKSMPIVFEGDYSKEENIMEFLRINAYHKTNFPVTNKSEKTTEEVKSTKTSDEMIKLEKEYDGNRINNASEF
jgi:protein disulfide-isomerase A1